MYDRATMRVKDIPRHVLLNPPSFQVFQAMGCKNAVDVGCGEGGWIKSLLLDPDATSIARVMGIDASSTALQRSTRLLAAAILKRKETEGLEKKPVPLIHMYEVRSISLRDVQFFSFTVELYL
jgi:2-polyprenyl-3-methyl-5-hydroxy-6-metoxy-1,4-benzoquinol methylase